MSADQTSYKIIAHNRRAKFDYQILEEFETGIILLGSEVKSLRNGKASINEAYAAEVEGELLLLNANIAEYTYANRFNHEAKRPRKLLLHIKQVRKILGSISKKGLTVVPLVLYFNHKGRVKLKIALARGKNLFDKRQTIKDRDWKRTQNKKWDNL